MEEIAKELVKMADKLDEIKACMADVKAGRYQPSDPAIVAAGL